MTPDRAIGNGIIEGVNCLAEIASTFDGENGSAANDSWLISLRAMEEALAAVRAGEVVSSMVISDEQVERIRQIREMVSNWLTAQHPPNELSSKVNAVLASLGFPLSTGDNEML